MKRIGICFIAFLMMVSIYIPISAEPSHAAASSIGIPLKNYKILEGFWVNRGNHYHAGVDMVCSSGATANKPVYAALGGTVEIAGSYGGYGNAVMIRTKINGKKYYFVYGHLNGYNVKVGDSVNRGDKIGKAGSTGYSTGPHLHFEIRTVRNTTYSSGKSCYLDPKKVLNGEIQLKTCKTHKADSKKGVCSNCSLPYTSWDTSELNTSTKTSIPGRIYKTNKKTNVKVYPASGATTKYSGLSAGSYVYVKGTIKSSWYKVIYGNGSSKVGYIPISSVDQFSANQNQSSLSVSLNSFTVKKGNAHDITGTVKSNYPITSISAKVDGSGKGTVTYSPAMKKSVNISDTLINTNIKCGKLSVGQHSLTITAKDISGKTVSRTATITVNGDVKAPTIAEINTSNGKSVKITQNESGGKLYYRIGSSALKSSSNNGVTIALNSVGKTRVAAYTEKNKKRSANIEKYISVSNISMPVINVEQSGKSGQVTIKTTKSGASIMYKVNNGAYKAYNGKVFTINDGDVVSAYAYQRGYIRSDVQLFTAEFAEPSAPAVTLSNADGKIAAGKTATVVWKKDKRASSYTARLYRSSDNSLVEEKETKECTESFTIKDAGEYYIQVTASNELGDSEPSEKVAVEAVAPLTVIFKNGPEENAEILAQVKADYGSTLSAITAPSRKGYDFEGWEDAATGEISKNAYSKNVVKEDKIYIASYEKKTYEVKIYDTQGKLIETQKVKYEESIDTESLMEAVNASLKKGHVFTGWSVTHTSDGSSNGDYTKVDSDMEVYAVAKWENDALPVIVEIPSAEQTANGKYVDAEVKLTTKENTDLSMYLVAALKSTDTQTGVQKTVYADRKIVYLDAADPNSESEKTVKLKLKTGSEAISTIEVMALQCNEDMTTGSAYSERKETTVTVSKRWGTPSEWSETKPEAKDTRIIEEKTQYQYRDPDIVYSSKDTLDGYTRIGTETLSTTYGPWRASAPSIGKPTETGTVKTVVSKQTDTAGKWYACYCNCKKVAWKTTSGTCKYCGGKTKNKLVVYTDPGLTATYYDSSDKSYYFNKKLTVSQNGNVRLIHWNGNAVDSFETKSTKATYNGKPHTYLWKSESFKTPIYRTKTVKTRNKFSKMKAWSSWSDTEPAAQSGREIKKRTVYRYSDEIKDTTGTVTLDTEGMYRTKPGSKINSAEDLSGKNASILVYQANNSDPNKYQIQYLGQTTIGEGNSYEFSLIPREKPTVESGNYIVALAVEETTGLIKVDTIEAPKAEHKITVQYKDEAGKDISTVKTVRDHEDLDMSDITIADVKGYYFGGWTGRTTDIREDGVVTAQYVPVLNSVVFVDWINQNLDIISAKSGTTIELPGTIKDTEGYTFTGWKLEDGTVLDPEKDTEVKVTGNMVITAQFKPIEYTVTFHGADGKVIDTQKVKYGEAAEPPAYEAPEGSGTFAGWSTSDDWWSVERDVDVYPIMVFNDAAKKPEAWINTDEKTGSKSIVLETEEENAKIYYTDDGSRPDYEMIKSYEVTDHEEYVGSLKEYTQPIIIDDKTNMQIAAVAYVDEKNESEVCNVIYYAEDPEEEVTVSDDLVKDEDMVEEVTDPWHTVGNYQVKATAGKDVEVIVDLKDNPGITGYDVKVVADKAVFYPDADQYGDPVVVSGEVSGNDPIASADEEDAWRMKWSSQEGNDQNGNLFKLSLHVEDNAEEGIYPISVYYMPENTLDKDFYETELPGLSARVTSQASIDLNTLDVKLARTSYTYEGKAIEPAVNIEGLKENEDYTVSYENNVNAGTGKAVIRGTGGYEGTVEKDFTITPASISDADVKAIDAQEYTGKAVEPEVTLTFGGKTLEKDKDYTVSYSNNTEAGTAKAAVSGKGNFRGSRDVGFTIEKSAKTQIEELQKALDEANAQISSLKNEKAALEKDVTEAKKKQSEAETAAENARKAKDAAEKELASANADKAEAQAKLDAANADLAKAEKELRDAKKEVTDAEQKLADMTKAKEDAEKRAEEAEKKLEELQGGDKPDADFSRYAGTSRYETALKTADALKKSLKVDKFDYIIVADGNNYPDALAGSFLAKVKKAPLILVDRSVASEDMVGDYIEKNLSNKGTVYLLGGSDVVTARFEKSLKGIDVERLAGTTRYETNLEILNEAKASGEDLLACTGEGFADSLSASAVGKPILLVDNRGLIAEQKAYLDKADVQDVYLIGGADVVSNKVGRELKAYDKDGKTERIAGDNRYKTSVEVAKAFFPKKCDTAVLAYGMKFPDGLAGGPLAISLESPLLLVEDTAYTDAKNYAQTAGIKKLAVLGGTDVIADKTANMIVK